MEKDNKQKKKTVNIEGDVKMGGKSDKETQRQKEKLVKQKSERLSDRY